MKAKMTLDNLPCSNCKYFTVCGDPDRTEPCKGREVVKPFKLRVYNSFGVVIRAEFFETKMEMDDRYIELSMGCDHITDRPTAWELENGEWNRIKGY